MSEESLLGDWRAVRDVSTRMGVTVFTISAGGVVAVTQINKANHEIMVEAGPRLMEWKSKYFLNDFEPV